MKDMNVETVTSVVINLSLSTDDMKFVVPTIDNPKGYIGTYLFGSDDEEYYTACKKAAPNMIFAMILQSIGHIWGLSRTYQTTSNINLRNILLRVIKYNNKITKIMLTAINEVKALAVFTFEKKQRNVILPIVPIEYQIQSSLRKTSPPYFI